MTKEPIKLVITRTFDAPRAKVWKAWTDPDILKKWNAPHAFAVTLAEGELKVGGSWHGGMKSKEHGELFVGGVYKEIQEPDLSNPSRQARLVFTHQWESKVASWTVETLCTVELTEKDGKTTMVFTQTGFASDESRGSHETGWGECFEKLEQSLAGNKYPDVA